MPLVLCLSPIPDDVHCVAFSQTRSLLPMTHQNPPIYLSQPYASPSALRSSHTNDLDHVTTIQRWFTVEHLPDDYPYRIPSHFRVSSTQLSLFILHLTPFHRFSLPMNQTRISPERKSGSHSGNSKDEVVRSMDMGKERVTLVK